MSGHASKPEGGTLRDGGDDPQQRGAVAARLQEHNNRLHLLLKLTNSITSNLTLKEVLHTVAANVREVMRCDAANIALPATEPGTFCLRALDFPGSKGFFEEEQIVTPTNNSPAKRALETLRSEERRVGKE